MFKVALLILLYIGSAIVWNISKLMDDDHLKAMEKEGLEAPDAEAIKSSIRKSMRLQSKKGLSSCSNYVFKSHHRNSKHTMKSSKESVYFGSKIEEEKQHQDSANTASMKSSTVSPSFEYHVRVKEGTSIVVDLNMKRSDWLQSMEKQICICKNHNLTVGSDASMNSCVQNTFSLQSLSREIGKTLPLVVENTVSGSKQCWSKVEQNSEHVVASFENSEEAPLSDLSSLQKGSLCSRTGKTCNESLLNSTTEVNQEAGGNHSQSTVVNEERIKSAEEMEITGSEENTFGKSASDDGAKRKKRCNNSVPVHGQSHERILRSTPVFGGKIIERDGVKIRCSSRLQSK